MKKNKLINIINMQGVKINDLKIIKNNDGDIFHGLKNDDSGFSEFGEIYLLV